MGASETVLELLGPKLVREPIKSNPGREFYVGSWGERNRGKVGRSRATSKRWVRREGREVPSGASETVLELLGPKVVREPFKSGPGKAFYEGGTGTTENRSSWKLGSEGGTL